LLDYFSLLSISVANRLGLFQLQQDVNLAGVRVLRAYLDDYSQFTVGVRDQLAMLHLTALAEALADLEQLIEARAGDKCWEVLAHASAVTRALSGAKIVCCKSAKDRTSMAVTAEQGAQIAARYDSGEIVL
jgi:inositol polyphosphate-4-phosphatase